MNVYDQTNMSLKWYHNFVLYRKIDILDVEVLPKMFKTFMT